MRRQSFILGLGAQKAGSTWLFEYLSTHPQANMGGWKEFGFWDTLFLEDQTRRLGYQERLRKLEKSGIRKFEPSNKAMRKNLTTALRLMGTPDEYFPHFASLAEQSSGTVLVGDITPSYARLKASHLQVIKTRVEDAGFDLKPVFIVREPLSRLRSAYAMELRRTPGFESPMTFEDFAVSESAAIRTKYEDTVTALDSIFAPGGVYYAAYESFFTKDKLSELCSFLKIDYKEPNFEKKINPAMHLFDVNSAFESTIRKSYESTYEFLYNRFPDWNLRQLWGIEKGP
ncbi:hypothetical protein IMCC13023_03650 [Candidatus Aquiluna sp. IMCC13023]|uniref:sulfotransferase n=1 Tax=Candidatus Aquiluna sp. IMCC13023 TaxID=1081644 RepID=UPI00025B20CA|nr:sulfotransferase [Candidatus Aquiluna sp. IMCC13023]EIC91886.1 hypothetical protein IMCC13023_03650 [Candidatus Aquiluna sp. IMCC13023]